MRTLQRAAAVAAAAALSATGLVGAGAVDASAATPSGDRAGRAPFTFAVIGDIPYGADQVASFPGVVDRINADPYVAQVNHLGDIKSGSSLCSDDYFSFVRGQFDRFRDPLVYTPGDNEWTDCHRLNNGAYNPLERLAAVRGTFYPRPGRTLGQRSVRVASEAAHGFPENVRYSRAGVQFATLHVVGSNNSTVPWSGLGLTAPTPEQLAEVEGRTANDLAVLDATFDAAQAEGSKAVAVMIQADMFDPTVPSPAYADYSAFTPIVHQLATRAAAFDGPVYLFDGDSHVYNVDKPLATGSSWLSFYGVTTPAENLTRVTVEGSTTVDEYLRVSVRPHDPVVLTWERVPFVPAV